MSRIHALKKQNLRVVAGGRVGTEMGEAGPGQRV